MTLQLTYTLFPSDFVMDRYSWFSVTPSTASVKRKKKHNLYNTDFFFYLYGCVVILTCNKREEDSIYGYNHVDLVFKIDFALSSALFIVPAFALLLVETGVISLQSNDVIS